MIQQLVNTWLRQSELGINAVWLFFTRWCIQLMNNGTEQPATTNRTMLDVLWMLWMSDESDLRMPVVSNVKYTGT